MNSNKDLYVKIISIASLVVLGYIFFISVYNQIIVQSGGVFYIIIFGGILILAFVLLSLVTKLIEITGEVKDNRMWNFVEILLLCHLSYLFLVFRMAYKSTVPGEETVLYRAATLMMEGALADKGMDMINHLCFYPSQYLYAFILSVFFRIGGALPSLLVVLNAVMIIITAFLMDRVVRKIAGRACGIIAAMCTVFIPSQSFAVYSYSSEVLFCALLLLNIDLWLIILEADDGDRRQQLILSGLFGLSNALLCFVEPLMIIFVLVFAVYAFVRYKKENKNPMIMTAVSMAAFVLILLILTFIKSVSLGTDLGEVVSGGFSRYKLSVNVETSEKYSAGEVFGKFNENLDNQNTNVRDNYHFLVNDEGEAYTQTHNAWFSLGTQMSYMFVLVMSIACAFYMFRNRNKAAVPVFVTLITSFIVLFFRSTDEASTFFMFEILIITACCGLNYMYMNHHPELFATVSADTGIVERKEETGSLLSGAMEWGAVARAKKLIFVKKNEEAVEEPVMEGEGGMPGQNAGTAGENAMMHQEQDLYSAIPEPAAAPAPAPAPVAQGVEMLGGNVSPEGYFSFFDLSPTPAPVYSSPAPAPVSAPVEEYNEPEEGYNELVGGYNGPIEEYTEEEYNGSAEGYTGDEYDGSTEGHTGDEYDGSTEGYTGDEYSGSADEYSEEDYYASTDEYAEDNYDEPVEEYTEDDYSEPAEEYTDYDSKEPADGYSVDEYDEPAEEYTEYAQSSYEPQEQAYAQEHSEPADGYGEDTHGRSPASSPRAFDSTTKASFTSAAHALGFSLSDDFFLEAENKEEEEADYDEPSYVEETYDDPAYEEETYDDPAYEEEAYDDAPVYEPSYDAEIDEYSFGEGMPDISLFEEPSYEEASYEEEAYEEPAYDEPVYMEPVHEMPVFDEPVYMEPVHEMPVYDEPAYDEPVYMEPVHEMPVYEEAEPTPEPVSEPEPAPAPVPRKKVIKKKVVRRVVKKVEKPLPKMNFRDDLSAIRDQFEPVEELPTMNFKTDLSSIEEAFRYEDDYVYDDEIYDEPSEGEGTEGFIIEI